MKRRRPANTVKITRPVVKIMFLARSCLDLDQLEFWVKHGSTGESAFDVLPGGWVIVVRGQP